MTVDRKKIPHDAFTVVVFPAAPPPATTRKKEGWVDGRWMGKKGRREGGQASFLFFR